MTEVQLPFSAVLGVGSADLYTVPAGKTALVSLCQACNVDASIRTVTIQRTVAAESNAVRRLAFGLSVQVGGQASIIDKPLALAAGDKLQGLCSSANMIEVNGTILETTP